MDRLGLIRAHLLGWFGGGPHAFACAHAVPNRVLGAATLAGMAPVNEPDAMVELRVVADPNLFSLAAWAWAITTFALHSTATLKRQTAHRS